MGFLRALPENATMFDLFSAYLEPMAHLVDFEESLMRGPSPLTPGEREIIGAYTSGLNACSYCYRSHSFTAEELGVSAALLPALIEDVESAPIEDRLKPILHYVKKLTLTPTRLTDKDAAAVFDAGWDDDALFHAIAICAYFNFCNRITDGTGLDVSDATLRASAQQLAKVGYKKAYKGLGET